MMFAKQVSPEWQEDDLFYQYKDKKTGKYELGINDDYYVNDVIIYGNNEFKEFTNEDFDRLLELDKVYYELDYDYWSTITEFINAYLKRSNGKKYSTKDIHQWKLLFKKYEERYKIDDVIEDGLKLMTGKVWRKFTMRGCMQREWQYGYASEELSQASIDYIEMCYFNTGSEFIVYENEEDYENEENGYSIYCGDIDDLCDRVGCGKEDIEVYLFDGYKKIPQYKKA